MELKINPTDKLVFDLEMLQIDYNEEKKESLRKEIAMKYNVPLSNVEVNFKPITKTETGEKLCLASGIINDIQDPSFHRVLFEEWLGLKGVNDIDFDKLLDIDKRVNAFIDFDVYSKYVPYKIKYLKWDNYLSYGKGNYFDFTKVKGLVLLTGQPLNTCGKTTLAIDLLRFALFGKAVKSPTLDSVFNRFLDKETEVMVEAGIEINDVEYVIRRTITRPPLNKRTDKSKAKQKIEYFKLINGSYEDIQNCEGEVGSETQNLIKDTIGNIEDFDLVISATAYTLGDLLRMGQTDKGKLFSRWLGLLSIEEKERVAKDLWKKESRDLLSNSYNRVTLESEISDMTTVIEEENKTISELNEKLTVSNKTISDYNEKKTLTLSLRRDVKSELLNVDVVTLERKITQLNLELEVLRAKQEVKKVRYFEIKDVVFDVDVYNKKVEERRTLEHSQVELRANITNLNNDNKRIQTLIEQQTCPTCKQHIEASVQGGFVEANNTKIKEYTSQGIANKQKIDSLTTDIVSMEKMRDENNELNTIKLEMSAVKVNIDNIKLQIEGVQRQIEEVNSNKANIAHNNDIDAKVRVIDETINTETQVKEGYIRNIEQLKAEITNYGKEIVARKDIIDKLLVEEKTIRTWKIYQEMVGKDGIVKVVLRKALPIVNTEIARLLNGLCDFDVVLSIDESNKVCLDLIRGGKVMDLGLAASGWEGTISSIAIRSALGNIGALPKCQTLCLDEIIGGISTDNVENIFTLFRRMLNNYDNILHICHDPSLMDYHDTIVTIVKENNISKIVLN